jgi:hypothetical protein
MNMVTCSLGTAGCVPDVMYNSTRLHKTCDGALIQAHDWGTKLFALCVVQHESSHVRV